MYPIVFPNSEIKLKEENGQTYIFDLIRKKYLVLTPEEWVRQHLVLLLKDTYGYPKGMFRLEKGHRYNELKKRTDVMIFNAEGKVHLLAECKAHSEPINQKTLEQVMNYNLNYHANIVLITNGLKLFCFERKEGNYKQVADIPHYTGIESKR
jgi:hypothetical protein